MAINELLVLSAITILNVIVVLFAWKIGRDFESISWDIIVLAFSTLLLSRVISFLNLFNVISSDQIWVSFIDNTLIPLIFWILLGVGIIRMHYKLKSPIKSSNKIRVVTRKKAEKGQKFFDERKLLELF